MVSAALLAAGCSLLSTTCWLFGSAASGGSTPGLTGVLVRRQVPERYVFMGGTFDLPRTDHSPAVAVQQDPHHHRRVVGRHSPSILTSVDGHDLGQVQFVGYVGDKPRQMILRQPVLQRRREKEHLVQIAGAEALTHTTSVPDSGTFPYENVPQWPRPDRHAESISDRLLETTIPA